MTGQLTIDDALAARAEALRRVDEHADPQWKNQALKVIRRVCEDREDWHSDVLWEYGLDEPREARALGPVIQRAARLGWCERTDRVRPSVRSHLSGKSVWRSLIYTGQGSAAA